MLTESSRTLVSLPLLRGHWRSLRSGSTSLLCASAKTTFAKVNPIWAAKALP
jgi:hypothetical protein